MMIRAHAPWTACMQDPQTQQVEDHKDVQCHLACLEQEIIFCLAFKLLRSAAHSAKDTLW